MPLPKIGFEWKISIGNILSMLAMAGAAITAWYSVNTKAEDAIKLTTRIPQLEQRLTAAETTLALQDQSIDVDRTARLTFQAQVTEIFKSIEEDRREQSQVNAEITAQLAVIVSRLDEQREVLRSSQYYGPFTPGYPAWAAADLPAVAVTN